MPKRDLESSNTLCIQGKSKMNILCPTLSPFFCHHEFLQGEWTPNNESEVWAVSLSISKWPGSVPASELLPTETDSWPCYFGVTACIPLCTAISAYMAVEGLVMLLSWPASQSSFSSLVWCTQARIKLPNENPNLIMEVHFRVPSWRLAAATKDCCTSGGSRCLYKRVKYQGCFNPDQIIPPLNHRRGRSSFLPPGLFLLPWSCPEVCDGTECLWSAGTSEDREPHNCLHLTTGLPLLPPGLPELSGLPILVLSCLCAVKGEITHYGKARWDSVTLNQKEDFKRFLKPELSSAQPEVKYVNLCLGIKINRGLILKSYGTIRVFHTISQSLQFVCFWQPL